MVMLSLLTQSKGKTSLVSPTPWSSEVEGFPPAPSDALDPRNIQVDAWDWHRLTACDTEKNKTWAAETPAHTLWGKKNLPL